MKFVLLINLELLKVATVFLLSIAIVGIFIFISKEMHQTNILGHDFLVRQLTDHEKVL